MNYGNAKLKIVALTFCIVLVLVALLALMMRGSPIKATESDDIEDRFLLDTGSGLVDVRIGRQLSYIPSSLHQLQVSYPSIAGNYLLVTANDSQIPNWFGRELTGAAIFLVDLEQDAATRSPIAQGRRGALSANGKTLHFFSVDGISYLYDLESRVKRELAIQPWSEVPVVWVNDDTFLFLSKDKRLEKFSTTTKKITDMGVGDVIPLSLSPDNSQVISVNFDGSELFVYSLSSGDIRSIKKSPLLRIGISAVWFTDGKSVLYSRQSLQNQVRLDEAEDIYRLFLDGNEVRLASHINLFWAARIPAAETDVPRL